MSQDKHVHDIPEDTSVDISHYQEPPEKPEPKHLSIGKDEEVETITISHGQDQPEDVAVSQTPLQSSDMPAPAASTSKSLVNNGLAAGDRPNLKPSTGQWGSVFPTREEMMKLADEKLQDQS